MDVHEFNRAVREIDSFLWTELVMAGYTPNQVKVAMGFNSYDKLLDMLKNVDEKINYKRMATLHNMLGKGVVWVVEILSKDSKLGKDHFGSRHDWHMLREYRRLRKSDDDNWDKNNVCNMADLKRFPFKPKIL